MFTEWIVRLLTGGSEIRATPGDSLMSRVIFAEERCKGCLLCVSVCPKGIILASSRLNRQGYAVAEVKDAAACTACASCALICPDCVISVIRERKAGQTAERKPT